jgi:drug/metabolite transporter (DMT)-like permease
MRRTGVLLAAMGAIAYGVATVIGRDLADAGVASATALGLRFAIAAAVLFTLLVARGAPLRPLRGEWARIVALGAFGYTLESTLFYLSLERGTAAACVLLFYAYPAIVLVLELARARERMNTATAAALALSLGGTAVVVAAGGDVAISDAGVLLALGSAVAYALYLLLGRQLGARSDPMTTACWVAVGASAACLARGAVGGTLEDPGSHMLEIVGYGIATAGAFGLTFAALARISAGRTAVVMTLEALSAVLLAAIFLGEDISFLQALGGIGIVVAAAVIAAARAKPRVIYSVSVPLSP